MGRLTLRPILLCLAAGVVLLAAGLWAAGAGLPAVSLEAAGGEEAFTARFEGLARQLGVTLDPGAPGVVLTSRRRLHDPRAAVPTFGPRAGALADQALVAVSQRAARPDGSDAELLLGFTPGGEPALFHWMPLDLIAVVPGVRAGPGTREEMRDFAGLLAPPGRMPGESVTSIGVLSSTSQFPLEGGGPPEHVEILESVMGDVLGFRRPGNLEDARRAGPLLDVERGLLGKMPGLLLFLAAGGLFLVFLARRRIDLVNASLLAGLTFMVLVASSAPWQLGTLHLLDATVMSLVAALWVFLLWSTGESWLRALNPEFLTSFDALRSGRLGPRGGVALLCGLGAGAALAGVRLGLLAAAGALPGMRPLELGVTLPVFDVGGTPITDGLLLAAVTLLAAAVGRRVLPRSWALPAAAVAASLVAAPVELEPAPLGVAAGALLTGGLLAVFRRFELTGLLAAAVGMLTLPAVAVSALHLEWMPGSFALAAGGTLALGAAGFAGLRRPREEELRRMRAPAFVRRLAEERRLQHEMGLLARMQLGLLPQEVPRLEGWEISARSVLATEVGGDLYDFIRDRRGRLWVAAGDVSGHGYSCAIVHAMTKAALSSLVEAERTPGEVLGQVDRVLRSVHFERAFTSLTLLRLDPATGEGLVANAGHPYPLICGAGEVSEVEMPGLPLGQGPPRCYPDRAVRLEPGWVLLLCSDGLFEATDAEVSSYGFERPRELLAKAARWPSNEILEMVLADWRRHRGGRAAPDDTTVVVIKRLEAEETGR